MDLFRAYGKTARSGEEELGAWILAARNLVNRAEASRLLLKGRIGPGGPGAVTEARRVLEELRELRRETEAAVARTIKPSRTAETMSWMYDSMEAALAKAAGDAGEGRR